MTADRIISTIRRHGGDVVLLIYVDAPPRLEVTDDVRPDNHELIDLVRDHRRDLILELRRRYLTGAELCGVRWS